MKVIQSAGGPLIGFDRDTMLLWSGIAGKRFVGESSPFPNDYEAAGALTDGVAVPPCSIAKLCTTQGEGLLISMPLQTALIQSDLNAVYLAQVHYAEHEWSFSLINTQDFELATYDEVISFNATRREYVVFDAAYPGEHVEDDLISFELTEGRYCFSAAIYQPDESTLLSLYRLMKS